MPSRTEATCSFSTYLMSSLLTLAYGSNDISGLARIRNHRTSESRNQEIHIMRFTVHWINQILNS